MQLVSFPNFDPMCPSSSVIMKRESVPSPNGLTCKPCVTPIAPANTCGPGVCGCFSFCFRLYGVVVTDGTWEYPLGSGRFTGVTVNPYYPAHHFFHMSKKPFWSSVINCGSNNYYSGGYYGSYPDDSAVYSCTPTSSFPQGSMQIQLNTQSGAVAHLTYGATTSCDSDYIFFTFSSGRFYPFASDISYPTNPQVLYAFPWLNGSLFDVDQSPIICKKLYSYVEDPASTDPIFDTGNSPNCWKCG